MRIKLVLLVSLTVFLFSCNKHTKPANFDYGTVENNVYTNNYFDFTMNLPVNWDILSQSQTEQLQQNGMKSAAGTNKELKKVIKASSVSTASLLSIFKYINMDTTKIDFNPSIIVVAERINQTPALNSAEQYLIQTSKLLKRSTLIIDSIDNQIYNHKISDKRFSELKLVQEGEHNKVHQDYYCVIIKDFAVSFIITYTNDIDKQELTGIINSIHFFEKPIN